MHFRNKLFSALLASIYVNLGGGYVIVPSVCLCVTLWAGLLKKGTSAILLKRVVMIGLLVRRTD